MKKVSINKVLSDILMRLPVVPSTQQLIKIKYFLNHGLSLMKVTKALTKKNDVLYISTCNTKFEKPNDIVGDVLAVFVIEGEGDNEYRVRLGKAYNESGVVGDTRYVESPKFITLGDQTIDTIGITYLTHDKDGEGFLQIPDKPVVTEALYWFIAKCLIGIGYKGFPFQYEYADQQWEMVHSPRAIEAMKTFTPEDAEVLLRQETKLVWNYHQWEDFHENERELLNFNVGIDGDPRKS